MTVQIYVQARMGASRLPGKPLLKVLGRTLLSYLLQRLKRSKLSSKVVVLTTQHPRDDLIIQEAISNGADAFRGSEENVLERYFKASEKYNPEIIVRITADCPLMDPAIIDEVVALLVETRCDYASNTLERTYPRGMDVEAFTAQALKRAYENAADPFEKEHVTPYFYRRPEQFKIAQQKQNVDHSDWRWTVDTYDDYILISKLISALYPQNPSFNLNDLTRCYLEHPEWASINAHVVQKNTPSTINGKKDQQ